MFWWLMVLCTGIAAGKMADSEDRTPWPWGIGAAVAAWGLPAVMGSWGLTSPVVALAGVFALLWWLRSRDERNDRGRPGNRVVR